MTERHQFPAFYLHGTHVNHAIIQKKKKKRERERETRIKYKTVHSPVNRQ